jgi:hypothetical protein
MFPTTDEVTRALRAYARSFGTRSRSVMSTNGNGHDFQDDPFGHGFIENLEARTALLSRFSVLDERERATLALWYRRSATRSDALGQRSTGSVTAHSRN